MAHGATHLGWLALPIAITLIIYMPSLGYGLIWDDPIWYSQPRGKTFLDLISALPTYQFYRPLSLLLNQQFLRPDGVVDAGSAHVVQVAAHLAAVLLVAPALAALGLPRRISRLSALAFALWPMSFQAVAWAAPQGPQVMLWLLLALWLAGGRATGGPTTRATDSLRQGPERRESVARMIGSWLAFTAALLFQESALPFVVVFVLIPNGRRRLNPWAVGHALIAAAYVLIWLNVPRLGGVTGEERFDVRVLAYFLQTAVFPVGRLAGGLGWTFEPAVWLGVYAIVLTAIAGHVAFWVGPRPAWLGLLLIALGTAPAWYGLSWEYVYVGERLSYVTALGGALLWGALVSGASSSAELPSNQATDRPTRSSQRLRLVIPVVRVIVPLAAGTLFVVTAGWHLSQMRALYGRATAHLQAALDVLAARDGEAVLFVNFPDRIELRPRPYPLGFFGITLAPVIQDLRDFAVARDGRGASDVTLAAFATGALERDAWAYRVDLRGVDTSAEGLLEAALPAAAVYLSEYGPGEDLRLRNVGDVRPAGTDPAVATIPGRFDLIAGSQLDSDQAALIWRPLAPGTFDDAVFVHVYRDSQFEGDIGGDALGGLIPIWAWRPGIEVVDRRLAPGVPELRIGMFSRASGERLPLILPGGQGLPDEALVLTR
jgi:hypothetical protein